MNMIRHYHVPHHHETIALANLFENLQKQIAVASACQPGLAMVANAVEKVR